MDTKTSLIPHAPAGTALSFDPRTFDKLVTTGTKIAVLGELTKIGIEQLAETHRYASFLKTSTLQQLNQLYQSGSYTQEQAVALIQSDLRFLAHIDQLEDLNAALTGQTIMRAASRKR